LRLPSELRDQFGLGLRASSDDDDPEDRGGISVEPSLHGNAILFALRDQQFLGAETLAGASVISAHMVGDSEAEIEMADRAVALNPNSWSTWNCRGTVYRLAGLPEEAIRSYERAVRMSPVDPRLYMTFDGIAMAHIELGRFDEAIVAGKKAQRQNPSLSGAYRCLASAFAHLGRDGEAHDAAARVLEIDAAYTISAFIARAGVSNAKLFIEGLRKAGLPE
jgi:adenylate cyclase